MAGQVTEDEALEMKRLYLNEKLSLIEIRDKTGRDQETVSRHLHRLGVEIRTSRYRLPELPVGTVFHGSYLRTVAEPYFAEAYGKPSAVVEVECTCGQRAIKPVHYLLYGSINTCGHVDCVRSFRRQSALSPDGREAKMAWLYAEKDAPCVDCDKKYPPKIMQFDHVPGRGKKKFTVSYNGASGKRTLREFQIERAKCDLVCPTCHALRTLARQEAKVA